MYVCMYVCMYMVGVRAGKHLAVADGGVAEGVGGQDAAEGGLAVRPGEPDVTGEGARDVLVDVLPRAVRERAAGAAREAAARVGARLGAAQAVRAAEAVVQLPAVLAGEPARREAHRGGVGGPGAVCGRRAAQGRADGLEDGAVAPAGGARGQRIQERGGGGGRRAGRSLPREAVDVLFAALFVWVGQRAFEKADVAIVQRSGVHLLRIPIRGHDSAQGQPKVVFTIWNETVYGYLDPSNRAELKFIEIDFQGYSFGREPVLGVEDP
jgi:hypothetical protein